MAGPNADWNEITVTTHKKRQKKFADNVLNHNALLSRLMAQGNVRMLDGGETIVEELEYAENTTFKYYSGYELLDVEPSEVFSAAEYDWKQAAVIISASGLELRKNSGETRTIRLLESRMKNGNKTMKNQLSIGAYSNGTAASGKQIGGLQHLVADTPTNVVGGIDRNTTLGAFFKNVFDDDTVNDSTTIQGLMNAIWLQLVRGPDHPDVIVADSVIFGTYQKSLQTIQRITEPKKGASGFSSLEFYGTGGSAPVVYDDAAPASHSYFLNTDYLFWNAHEEANFEALARRDSFNQDAVAVPVIFQGNMSMSNGSLQGVLF